MIGALKSNLLCRFNGESEGGSACAGKRNQQPLAAERPAGCNACPRRELMARMSAAPQTPTSSTPAVQAGSPVQQPPATKAAA